MTKPKEWEQLWIDYGIKMEREYFDRKKRMEFETILTPDNYYVEAKTLRPTTHRMDREFFKSIQVKFEIEGFHSWKDAPQEVAFLRHSHRHLFGYLVEIEVKHNNRELEYFMVLNDIKTKVTPFMNTADMGSCEQQAEFVANGVLNLYGDDRFVSVSVFEDDENGSSVIWDPRGGA